VSNATGILRLVHGCITLSVTAYWVTHLLQQDTSCFAFLIDGNPNQSSRNVKINLIPNTVKINDHESPQTLNETR
jgi:hypothetical protein